MADNKPTDEEFFDDELAQDGLSERLDDLDEELAIARAASLRAGLDDYDLDEEDFELLDTVTEDPDKITYLPALPVLAVVGRPNVGKSALVNRIIGRREAVVEDRQPGHRLLHQPLGGGIQRGGGLVQDEDGGVLVQGPRDRQPLALAARQFGGVVPGDGVQALRQGPDQVAQVGRLQAAQHPLGVGFVLQRHVARQGVVEHHHEIGRAHV